MLPMSSIAAIDAYPFPDDEMRDRYHALIDELRCPKCLNTNLAGSDSMIAKDLRREVHRLILEGKSDAEVLDFMHQRYGDFILYDPQLKPSTWLLWFGPLLLFMVALVIVFNVSRRYSNRQAMGQGASLSDDEQSRLDKLISSAHSGNSSSEQSSSVQSDK
ncbi:MAG TPA: cytochrome c-type biogenesis protein CcmH [Pseudomonadales bacterium]|nr:cytochrome c-type biogenesis protein CcmH [Pseudomonadales bacterium]